MVNQVDVALTRGLSACRVAKLALVLSVAHQVDKTSTKSMFKAVELILGEATKQAELERIDLSRRRRNRKW